MPEQRISIRRADISDAPSLASCIDAAYAQYAGRIKDLPPVSEGCAEDISGNQVWVAVDGDEIVGGLVMVLRVNHIKLANLAVRPDHAGRGIGKKLIELAEHEALRRGFAEMRLNTHAGMTENIALYGHLGWEEIARDGNTVAMRKCLTRPGSAGNAGRP